MSVFLFFSHSMFPFLKNGSKKEKSWFCPKGIETRIELEFFKITETFKPEGFPP